MSAKTFKLVIISILLAITALLPGELFQGYMDQYNDFYETSFYLQSGKTAEEMNRDLSSAAETYNIHIFKIYTRSKTTYSVCLDIYADDAMVQILSSQYCIREGTYQSLFSGSTEINIYPFSDIPDDLMEEDEVYYLYGDYDDTVLFKQSLVDIYAGSFPKDNGYNGLASYQGMLICAWVLVIVIALLLGVYDLMTQKKEVFISVTMGMSRAEIYLRNILPDTACMLAVYLILRTLIRHFEGSLSFDGCSNIMFLILLFANALVFLGVFRTGYSALAGKASVERKLLTCNYILCAICSFLFLAGTGSYVEMMWTSYSYSEQEEFFDEHSDYVWCQRLQLPDVSEDVSEEVLQTLLNEFVYEYPESFFYICEGGEFGLDEERVFYTASSGTKDYLKENFSVLASATSDCDIYILVPDGKGITEDDLTDLTDWLETDSCEILRYSTPVDIICRELDNDPITDTVTNPVIVFYNHEQDIPAGELVYEFFLGMVDDSDGQWSEYASANGISYMGTNAWDYFCYRWEALSRTVLVNLVAVVIMAVLMILSVYVVIRMEFQVNAQEVALKKIYGYTNLQRFRKLYGLTVISAVICLIGLIVLKCIGVSVPLRYVFPALLLFALIECAFISLQIAFYDRKNLQNILKGGNV
ncbi:MAG: hypothetical protein LUE29_04800 [Lachnospiraceae bacterium]|nr:hypothetical protein [Lachnospiraceae bacterium]